MMEDGCHVGDMDIEEVVTIVDKIKAELIKGGTQVVGYTDQIDADSPASSKTFSICGRSCCQLKSSAFLA